MLSSTRATATVQQVLAHCNEASFIENGHALKVLSRIRRCRTAALGYHLYECSNQIADIVSISTIVAETGTVPVVALLKSRNG